MERCRPQVRWANKMGPPFPADCRLSLLGLMAKIKCSICSYQFNIWYAGHRPAHILIWFLAFGQGSEACLTLTTGCLGIALQPSAAHSYTKKISLPFIWSSYRTHGGLCWPYWAIIGHISGTGRPIIEILFTVSKATYIMIKYRFHIIEMSSVLKG